MASRNQRILLVGSYGPSLLNFRGPLIARMIALGHDVHVAAPDVSSDLEQELQKLGAKVHRTPLDRQGTGLLSDFIYLQCLTRLCREILPDLVITYTIKPNIWGAIAGSRTGVRTVAMVTGLGITFTETGETSKISSYLTRRIVRFLYRRATNRNWRVVFQNSDDLEDFIRAGCLRNTSKVRMTNGSGVDLRRFTHKTLPSNPNFLMISRILGAKGVREYAHAAIQVRKLYPHARFRLVGYLDRGPDMISEKELSYWVANGLEYFGHAVDVRPHLADCRVYVLPSYREGTPRSVLEAMATGRAILTTDAPGCRETVVFGKNGFLVPVQDVKALTERMIQFIQNPQLADLMGRSSLKIVHEKYDVDKVNVKLLRDLDIA